MTLSTEERINVSVRLRPSSAETALHEAVVCRQEADTYLKIDHGSGERYACDNVFDQSADNEREFNTVVEPMLTEALRGKNATVFAYGQTGSGKTYTMNGLMNLAADRLFKALSQTPGREFLMKLSAVEVYNEHVHDLLRIASKRLDVVENAQKQHVVKNLREETLVSSEYMHRLLQNVGENRRVRETEHNVNSSRSHQIVTILIESRTQQPESTADGGYKRTAPLSQASSLTFVDLAGSEPSMAQAEQQKGRPGTAQGAVEKQRAMESSKINKSLLTLSRVIKLLADGRPCHIPFRESNLTRLLQPCLGGNSKTAIIATVCPGADALDNTRATMHFVNLARRVKMRPVVNVVDDSESRIKMLEEQVERLKDELKRQETKQENAVNEQHMRRIAGLERMILTAAPGNRPRTARHSVDLDTLPSNIVPDGPETAAPGTGILTQSLPNFSRAALAQLAGSQRPGTALTPPLEPIYSPPGTGNGERPSTAAQPRGRARFTPAPGNVRLMDCIVTPEVRAKLQQLGAAEGVGRRRGNRTPSPPGGARGALAAAAGARADVYSGAEGDGLVAGLLAELRAQQYLGGAQEEGYLERLEELLTRVQDQEQSQLRTGQASPTQIVNDLKSEIERLQTTKARDSEASSALAYLRENIRKLASEFEQDEPSHVSAMDIEELVRRKDLPVWLGDAITEASGNSAAVAAAPEDAGEVATSRERPAQAETLHESAPARPEALSVGAPPQPSARAAGSGVGAAAHSGANACESYSGTSEGPNMASPRPSKALDAVTAESQAPERSKWPTSASQPRSLAQVKRMQQLARGTRQPLSPRASQQNAVPRAQPESEPAKVEGVRASAMARYDNGSVTTSMKSHMSGGSSNTSADEELKSIIIKAVNGMKAQEAQRFKAQMRELTSRWKAAAERHVEKLQSVLQEIQQSLARAEDQKKWLFSRVVTAEMQAENAMQLADDLEAELGNREDEVASLQDQVEELKERAAAEALPMREEQRSLSDTMRSSSWGGQQTASELLADIVALWDKLHVPLIERSRFLIAHRGKDLFYLQAERGHLVELDRSLDDRARKDAKMALYRERNKLASRLKEVYSEDDRAQLYSLWNISQTKERKKALAWRLWDPSMTEADLGYSSAELVLILHGWNGDETFGGVMCGLKDDKAGARFVQKVSGKLVSRASSFLRQTPRGGGGGGPPSGASSFSLAAISGAKPVVPPLNLAAAAPTPPGQKRSIMRGWSPRVHN